MRTSWLGIFFIFQAIGQGSFPAGAFLTRSLLHPVTLSGPNSRNVQSIVYGNPIYGYFETRAFRRLGDKIQLALFPPGYQLPVVFYLKTDTQPLVKSRSVHFYSKVPRIFHRGRPARIHGTLQSNYVLLTGTLPKEDSGLNKDQSYYYLINRLGEIVWLYLPTGDGERGLLKFVDGKYLLETQSHFLFLDSHGETLEEIRPTFLSQPYEGMLRHDFLLQSSGNLLGFVRKFAHGFCLATPLSPSYRFVGSALVSIDRRTKNMRALWDSFQTHHPLTLAPVFDPFSLCQSDGSTTKATSISEWPRGYLVSVVTSHAREKDKIVLLDKDAKKTVGTIGADTSDTYQTPSEKDRFRGAYQISTLPSGNLLFLDRGRIESRIVELHLADKTATVVREFRANPPLYSFQRGSAYVHANTVVAFFSRAIRPLDLEDLHWTDYLVEFDYTSGKETARMRFDYKDADATSYRAFPLEALGEEKFWGRDFRLLNALRG